MDLNRKTRRMKLGLKSLFSFSLLLLSGAVALSAGLGPNTAKKFEGVWRAPDGSRIYMGPVELASQTGSYVVRTEQGQKFEHVYEILSSDEVNNTIRIQIEFADTRMPSVQHELTLQKDPTKCTRKIVSANMPVAVNLFRRKSEALDVLTYVSRDDL